MIRVFQLRVSVKAQPDIALVSVVVGFVNM